MFFLHYRTNVRIFQEGFISDLHFKNDKEFLCFKPNLIFTGTGNESNRLRFPHQLQQAFHVLACRRPACRETHRGMPRIHNLPEAEFDLLF